MSYDAYTKYNSQVADTYDRDREGEAHWREEQEFLASFVRTHSIGRVLDMPVGTGRFLEFYAQAKRVVGIDISDDMLRVSADKIKVLGMKHVALVKGDATAVEYPDGEFETIICFRLVHLLPPAVVPLLFAELARLSCGTVLVQVYAAIGDRRDLVEKLGSLAGRIVRRLVRRQKTPWSHIRSYPHREDFILAAARRAGLRLLEAHSLSHYEGSAVQVLEFSK